MLKIELDDAKLWLQILEAIKDIVEETIFIATPNELTLRAMDSAKVAMVDLRLPSMFFANYQTEKEEVKIGFSIVDMVKTLKGIKKGYRLTIDVTEDNLLKLTFLGKGTHVFEFPLLDITTETLPTLKLKFDSKIKIETDLLYDTVKNLEKFSDYLIFKAYPDKFVINARSEKGRANSEFTRDDLIAIEVEKESITGYSTEYLLNILGKSELSEVTILEFSTKNPLKVTYPLVNEGEFVYYLAPRTEIE
jgi:proliferating cell nuclear antigen